MGKLTRYFTTEETVHSDVAERLEINNTPTIETRGVLLECARRMDKIREFLGFPVLVSSWYRSAELNKVIKGSRSSRHMYGEAVDFICPAYGPPLAVARTIQKNVELVDYDQLILEYTWVHISFAINPPRKARREVLTLLPDKSFARGLVNIKEIK